MIRELGKVTLGVDDSGEPVQAGSFEAEQAVLANAGLPPLIAKPSESIPLAAEIVRDIVIAGAVVIAGAAVIAAAAPAAVAGAGATAAAGEVAGAGAIAGAAAAPAAVAGEAGALAGLAGAAAAPSVVGTVGLGTIATGVTVAGTAVGVGQQLGLLPGHTSQPQPAPVGVGTAILPDAAPPTVAPLTFWSWLRSLFGGK
jgi:hypothetical protein